MVGDVMEMVGGEVDWHATETLVTLPLEIVPDPLVTEQVVPAGQTESNGRSRRGSRRSSKGMPPIHRLSSVGACALPRGKSPLSRCRLRLQGTSLRPASRRTGRGCRPCFARYSKFSFPGACGILSE